MLMLNLRHMNPMVRAVGTMGAVSALVGGITFAQLTSNTVALSPNTLSTASANLEIGATNTGSCSDASTSNVPGFDLTGSTGLVPGVASAPIKFCLKNTGDVKLDLTTMIPQTAFASDTGIPPSDVTLNITCGNSGTASGTLDHFTTTSPKTLGSLSAGVSTDCQATATLNSDFSGASGASVPSFDIQFVGTESTTV